MKWVGAVVPGESAETARGLRSAARIAIVAYVLFGFAFVGLAIAYCKHRADVGRPSDLPCVSLLWNSMEFASWPVYAFGFSFGFHEAAVPLPFRFRVIAWALLAGYVVTNILALIRITRSVAGR